jgi:hypothetical protein
MREHLIYFNSFSLKKKQMQPNEDIYFQCFEMTENTENGVNTCAISDTQCNNYATWLGEFL